MADFTLTTTDAQDDTLAWHLHRMYGETLPLAAASTWIQGQLDSLIASLAQQKQSLDFQTIQSGYAALDPSAQPAALEAMRTILGLES